MSQAKVALTSTSISQVHLSFSWSLENVSQLLNTKRGVSGLKVVRSPNFFSDADEDTQWYLEVYPKGRDDPSNDFVSIFITLDCAVQSEVVASYKISVINANGSANHTFREEAIRFCEGDVRGSCSMTSIFLKFQSNLWVQVKNSSSVAFCCWTEAKICAVTTH